MRTTIELENELKDTIERNIKLMNDCLQLQQEVLHLQHQVKILTQ